MLYQYLISLIVNFNIIIIYLNKLVKIKAISNVWNYLIYFR